MQRLQPRIQWTGSLKVSRVVISPHYFALWLPSNDLDYVDTDIDSETDPRYDYQQVNVFCVNKNLE